MSDAKHNETTTPRGAARETVRRGDVRGLTESARQWARQQGLSVPTHGPLPPEVVAQYRRRQTFE
ncbi:Lsr2 family protein [Actinomycetospora sp. TBRC 11914]|uniref:Lsr2 family DNA-binding protein n=1 Tax=Actinomycetospora sp. TBRC 11914 TaxID=2729387 RepID=UPI00145DD4A7|nr:Lsr2 family protein [Actinomycetospora sp. TBRC 11914]NMO90934.1 hypothetical protein [Actinomycetospora sp. TBRC 11914]